jgi:hypothetical protein
MAITQCTYPWTWFFADPNGAVRPCRYTAEAIGFLTRNSAEEIWNSERMMELRQRIKTGEIHPICARAACPYLRDGPREANAGDPAPFLTPAEAASFDEQEYLRQNPDVAQAVARGAFSGGLEHFTLHGREEGRIRPDLPMGYPRRRLTPSDEAIISFTEADILVAHAPIRVVTEGPGTLPAPIAERLAPFRGGS